MKFYTEYLYSIYLDLIDVFIILCIFGKGIAFDGPDGKDITIVKKEGKVVALEDELLSCKFSLLENCRIGLTILLNN